MKNIAITVNKRIIIFVGFDLENTKVNGIEITKIPTIKLGVAEIFRIEIIERAKTRTRTHILQDIFILPYSFFFAIPFNYAGVCQPSVYDICNQAQSQDEKYLSE